MRHVTTRSPVRDGLRLFGLGDWYTQWGSAVVLLLCMFGLGVPLGFAAVWLAGQFSGREALPRSVSDLAKLIVMAALVTAGLLVGVWRAWRRRMR